MTRPFRGSVPIILALLAVPLAACNVEAGDGQLSNEEATHIDKVFSGYVTDEFGLAIPGATVSWDDGEESVTTNSAGQFVALMEFYDGRESMDLVFQKDGFLPNNTSIPIYDETSTYTTMVSLYEAVETHSLNVDIGGRVDFEGGELRLVFEEGAFADEFGNTIIGDIDVAARVIRPEDLRPDRMPISSMMARDPATPDQDVMIASYGMFNIEATQDGIPVYPAAGSEFRIVITGIDRFIEAGALSVGNYIPLWTMVEDDTIWDFQGAWFEVVELADPNAGGKIAGDELVGSDNTMYAVVVDVPIGGASGDAPPPTQSYNCDARPILSCITGNVNAEGLYYDDEIDDVQSDLETKGVAGAWVGFRGTGIAENCQTCECTTVSTIEVCEDVELDNGETEEQCRNEIVETDSEERPVNAASGDSPCDATNPNKICSCSEYSETTVIYQGSTYTDANGNYCATVGARGRVSQATVLKDWLITETDPNSGAKQTYPVSYEHNENPRLGNLETGRLCGEGGCGTWNHTMPCEWFWQNNACAVVGGCEVHALRDFDEEEHISSYEDDETYPY